MCKAPKPPKPKEPIKPEFLHNRYLDSRTGTSAIGSLKEGRSSLRVPLGSSLKVPGTSLVGAPSMSSAQAAPAAVINPASGAQAPRINNKLRIGVAGR